MLSYWEKQSLLHYDVVIIGSGIVGLSTAISLKEKDATKRILVLERAILPTGASTKNAGFACIGSLTEILDDLIHMSESEVLSLVELRYCGLNRLRKRLGDATIGYAANGSYELISSVEEQYLNKLAEVNQLLRPILGADAFTMCNGKIETFNFSPSYTKHLIQNNFEGELHTGKMMRALIDMALQKGIEIKTGCEVERVEEEISSVRVVVKHQYIHEEIAFSANKVALCTNAFTTKIFPEAALKPGRGLVLITEPIPDLPFKGIFHFDKGYYYFRNIDNRVLFGGGRNKDFAGEETMEFDMNEIIQHDLLQKLQQIILPNHTFKVADWWAGIMAFGNTKFPILERKSHRIFMGVRMGGMGVAIGSEIGEKLAEMMLQ
jgi:glycine/D-amino acid oxidase-like deaminating enzyme